MPVPVVVTVVAGVELAPIDFIAPPLFVLAVLCKPGLISAVRKLVQLDLFLFWVTLGFAVLAVLLVPTSTGGEPTSLLRQFGSMVFTFRPLMLFFLGALIGIWCRGSAGQVVKYLGVSAAVSCIIVAVYLHSTGLPNYAWGEIEYGGRLQVGEHLNGSYLGMQLYGRYGVNSLAETYAIYCALAFAALLLCGRELRNRTTLGGSVCALVLVGGIFSAVQLCITSESRQAIVATSLILGLPVLVSLLKGVWRMNHRGATAVVLALAIAAVLFALEFVLALSSNGQLETFSAGRGAIAQSAWQIMLDRPLSGIGFSAFQSDNVMSNAHNLLLNMGRKAGILTTVAYLALLAHITFPVLKRLLRGIDAPEVAVVGVAWIVLVAVVGLVSNSLDVVTASGPILFVIGINQALANDHSVPEQIVDAS